MEILSQQSNGAKDAEFGGRDGDAERGGDFFVGPFLDEGENGGDAQGGRKAREGLRGFEANLGGDAGIGCGRRGKNSGVGGIELALGAAGAEPIERGARSDAAGPGLEGTRGIEAGASGMNSPESFDGEVFSGAGVADDAEDPAEDGPLMLAEESFECIEIALPELIQYVRGPVRHRCFPF